MTLYYFGCWNEAGHYLREPDGRNLGYRKAGPFEARHVDTIYAPWPGEDETKTNLVHTNGWTVLAMWDRSVDTRPGSNAAFFAEGRHSESEMWSFAQQQYPQVVARLRAAVGRLDAAGEP